MVICDYCKTTVEGPHITSMLAAGLVPSEPAYTFELHVECVPVFVEAARKLKGEKPNGAKHAA